MRHSTMEQFVDFNGEYVTISPRYVLSARAREAHQTRNIAMILCLFADHQSCCTILAAHIEMFPGVSVYHKAYGACA